MPPVFSQQIEAILASERFDAYRQDGASPEVALGRYFLNMALCESLYSPLQFAEIALRNSIRQQGLNPWIEKIQLHWPMP